MTNEMREVLHDDLRFNEALAAYYEEIEAGLSPNVEEFLARYPDLADELASFFSAKEAFEHGAAPLLPGPGTSPAVQEAPSGTKIRYVGDYELLEEIARGGMGVVYKARQLSLERIVALKMIRAGALASDEQMLRFQTEAAAAASLDHPHIVPIYEIGTHDDLHYFSMKLIDGPSLAQRLAAGPAEPRDAARLLATVARAVHHAHQRGVLHRDLKPANVLLDVDGQPHVTDFGLAKRSTPDGQALTQSHVILGTASYLSPEQASGQVKVLTTATDVYGLGAILYEALTGQPPFRGETLLDTLRRVQEEEPPPPRKLVPGTDPDLETICLRCLEKDIARRYGSAEELAEDLDRWLAGEPILARPAGRLERLTKWARRRPAVAGLAAALLALVVVGVPASIWQAVRATHAEGRALAERDQKEEARREAEASAEKARAAATTEASMRQQAEVVASFLESMFQDLDAKRATTDLRSLLLARLDLMAADLEKDHASDPLLRARLRTALGHTQLSLGEAGKAVALFELALAERRQHLPPNHHDTLASMNNLALAYQAAGRVNDAVPLFEEAHRKMKTIIGPDHPETLSVMDNLGKAYQAAGRLEEAVALLKKAMEGRKAHFGAEHPRTLTGMNNLANAYYAAGQHDQALELYEETLRLMRKADGPEHPDLITVMSNLSAAYQSAGQTENAVKMAELAVENRKKVLGPDHPGTFISINNLATAYQAAGQLNKAVTLLEEVLLSSKARLPPDHPDLLNAMNNLALAYHEAGKRAKALPLLEEAFEKIKAKFGPDHPNTLNCTIGLASAYRDAGRLREALPMLEQGLEKEKIILGPDHPSTLSTMNNLGLAYLDVGRPDQAEKVFNEAMTKSAAKLGDDHPTTLSARKGLAQAFHAANQPGRALALFEQVLTQTKAKLGPNHPHTLCSMNDLGAAYREAGRLDQARPLLEEAVKKDQIVLGPNHPDTLASVMNLGWVYLLGREADKARALFEETLSKARVGCGPEHSITRVAMTGLAMAYQATGQLDKAVPVLEEAFTKTQAKLGPNHPDTLGTRNMLIQLYQAAGKLDGEERLLRELLEQTRKQDGDAAVAPMTVAALGALGWNLLKQEKYAEAESYLRRCLVAQAKLAPDHPVTCHVRSVLGAALLGQKKYAEAEPLFLQGYEGMKQRESQLGPLGGVRITEAFERLVKLYEAWDRPELARKFRKELDARRPPGINAKPGPEPNEAR